MTVHPLPGRAVVVRPSYVQLPAVVAVVVGVWLLSGVTGAVVPGVLVLAVGLLGIVFAEWLRIAGRRADDRTPES